MSMVVCTWHDGKIWNFVSKSTKPFTIGLDRVIVHRLGKFQIGCFDDSEC